MQLVTFLLSLAFSISLVIAVFTLIAFGLLIELLFKAFIG